MMNTKNRLIRLLDTPERQLPVLRASAPEPIRVQSAHDVLDLLEAQINAVRAARGVGPLAQARVLGRLAELALRAVEVSQLEARLETLQAVLKQREKEAYP